MPGAVARVPSVTMAAVAPGVPPRTTPTPRLTERLAVPLWWWPAGFALASIAAAEVGLGAPGPRGWAPFAVLLPLTVLLLILASRLRVRVTADEFEVDDARLPVGVISDVVALDAAGKKALIGADAHPYAFVVLRPWVGTAVQVLLDDPTDPTPYWLVSTRRPLELAASLRAAAGIAPAAAADAAPAAPAAAVDASPAAGGGAAAGRG